MARKTDIRLRRSAVSGAVPGGADLNLGELALNTADGAIFVKNGAGNIVTVSHDGILHYDEPNSRVGIGETSPDRKLHVKDSNYRVAVFERTGAPNSYIMFADPNTTQDVGIGATTNNLKFRSGNVDHLSLLGSNGHLRFTDFDQQLEFGSSSNAIGYSSWNMSASAGGIIKNVAGPLTLNPDDFTAFQVNDAEKARINATGIGIGTNSPSHLLHVTGAAGSIANMVVNNDNVALRMSAYTNSHGEIRVETNHPLVFKTNGNNERARINSSGNFGIGNTNPPQKLTVHGAVFITDDLTSPGSAGTYTYNGTAVDYSNNGTRYWSWGSGTARGTFNFIQLENDGTNQQTAMSIDALGRVGINNTSPSSQYFNNLVIGDNSAGDKGITIRANSGNKGVLAFSDTDSADANRYTGYIAYQHTDNSMRFHTNGGGERMRITSAGNVGINASSPARRLEVNHHGATIGLRLTRGDNAGNSLMEFANTGGVKNIIGHDSGRAGFIIGPSTTPNVTIKNATGNVGIGTDSPGSMLHISDASSPEIRLEDSDATSTFNITTFQNTAGSLNFNTRQDDGTFVSTDYQIFKNAAGANIHKWFIGNSEKARLDANGNLLIGTTSTNPQSSSSVEGIQIAPDHIGIGRSGNTVLYLNRQSSDGIIVDFRKAGSSVGAIGTVDGDLNIFPSAGGHKGLRFGNGYIAPTGNGTAVQDATTDLGISTQRFKDIHLSGVANAAAFQSNQPTNGFGYLNFGDTDDANIGQIGYDHTDNYMRFQVNNTEKVRIIANGNVGIGTSSPDGNLEVVGTTVISTASDGVNSILMGLSGTNRTTIQLDTADTTHTNRQWGLTNIAGDFYIGRHGLTVMTMKNNGSVGIGNTNPGVPLDVNANSSAQGIRVRGRSTDDIGQIDLANNGGTVRSQLQWNNSFLNIKAIAAIPMIFYTNNAERMRIQSNGAVGIGTASPLDLLHIKSSSTDARFLLDGHTDFDAEIKYAEAGTVKFTTGFDAATDKFVIGTTNVDTQKRFTIDSSGKITFNEAYTFPTSIGSAGQVLKVPTSGTELIWGAASGGGGGSSISDNDDDTKIQVEESADEDIIRFDIAGTQKMLLNSTELNLTGDLAVSGNLNIVGDINSTSVTNLDVTDKTITVANNAGSAANANGAGIVVDTGTNNPQMIYTSGTDEWDFNRSIHVSGAAGSGVKINSGGAIVGGGASGGDTQLMFWGGTVVYYGRSSLGGTTSGHEFRIGGTTKLNVNSSGNTIASGTVTVLGGEIFLGTVDSSSGHINALENMTFNIDTDNDDTNRFFEWSTNGNSGSGTELMRLTDDGKLGLGTTSPSKKLHIQDNVAHQLQLHGGNSYWNIGAGWSGYYQDYLLFATNSGEKMVIDTNGNVGIGTNGPGAKLHIVNNSTSSDALLLQSSDDSSSAAPILAFKRNSASVADADYLGQLKFKGENDADQEVVYAKITSKILDASDGSEDGLIEFANRKAGSNVITARLRSDSLQLLNDTSLALKSDGAQLQLGNDNDMQIYHNGSAGEINNGTGDFTIDSVGDITLDADGGDIFLKDGGTQFGKFTQMIGGLAIGAGSGTDIPILVSSNKVLIFTDLALGDDEKIIIGDGATGNMQMFHDGTDSFIDDVAEGNLILRTNGSSVKMMSGSENMVVATKDGSVELYHNNVKKAETTSGGVAVYGEISGVTAIRHANSNAQVIDNDNDTYFILNDPEGINRILIGDSGDRSTSFRNDTFKFQLADGTEKMRMTSDGRFGIGIANPVTELTVAGTAPMLRLQESSASAKRLDLSISSAAVGIIGANQSASQLAFETTGSERLRINASGNVGIGTSSPGTTLHIQNTSTNAEVMRLTTTGDNPDRNMYFQSDHIYSNGSFYLGAGSHRNLYRGSYHTFHYGGSNTEAMRVNTNGYVGIGTTSPAAKFNVNSTSTIGFSNLANAHILAGTTTGGIGIDTNEIAVKGDHVYFGTIDAKDIVFRTAGANHRMRILSAGQIAINADSARTTGGTARLTIADSSVQMSMGPSNSDNMYIRRTGNGLFQFQTYYNNNTGHIELEPYGGKVGIGTNGTAPVATFQVETYGINTSSTTTTATTQVAIHSFAKADFRTARFTIQITNSTDSTYHSTEIIAVHDGTTANITEFGEVHTGSAVEATFDADINGSNFRLLATPTSTNSMTFKVVCHSITV